MIGLALTQESQRFLQNITEMFVRRRHFCCIDAFTKIFVKSKFKLGTPSVQNFSFVTHFRKKLRRETRSALALDRMSSTPPEKRVDRV